MGGFSLILGQTIDHLIDRNRANPRIGASIERLRTDLLQEIPAMRQQVQRHLNRVSPIPRRPYAASTPNGGPLREGSYCELRLRSEELAFTGIVDLLQIQGTRCSIWEFKTGTPDDQHAEQLRTYALLWTEDKTRNPDDIPVDRMILSWLAHASSDASLREGMQVRLLNVRQAEADGVVTIGISFVTEIFSTC